MLRNHLRSNSPEVAIRNNFVGINLAMIVASFNRTISKNQTGINISIHDVLFTNGAMKYRHKPHFVAEAPLNENQNKARTSVDTEQ